MPETFGTYTLLEQIGVGGMAEVFLARRQGVEGFEKNVVIKRILPSLRDRASFVNMFLAEGKLASQLHHPHIVQVFDLGKVGADYFIAMEFVPGRDMTSVMPKAKTKGIPFPIEYALKIASSVAEALHYAHTVVDPLGQPLKIVHRDVSPENIRVAWTGTVKILDFGIAKAATRLHQSDASEIKGKLSYMSPEQVQGKELDHRSDIFSLGTVLYEILTGFKLFAAQSDRAVMNNIVEHKIYAPTYFREDIPHEVEAIVMKALAKDPNNRYATAADLQYDIDTFLADHDFTPSNTHLANFMRQLFDDEMEHEKRVWAAVGSRIVEHELKQASPPPPPGSYLPAPEPTVDVDVEAISSDGVMVSLTEGQRLVLQQVAHREGTTVESVVGRLVDSFVRRQAPPPAHPRGEISRDLSKN